MSTGVTIAIHGEPAIVVREAHRYSGESGVWLGGGYIGSVEIMGELPAIVSAFRRFADAVEAELEAAMLAEPGTCPLCGTTGRPEANTEYRQDEPQWSSRNPVRCRVETCGGVGEWEDWGLAADGTALAPSPCPVHEADDPACGDTEACPGHPFGAENPAATVLREDAEARLARAGINPAEVAATFHVEAPDPALADLPPCETEVGS